MMQAASAVLSSKLTFIQRPEFRLPVPAVLLRQQVLPAGPLRLPIDQPGRARKSDHQVIEKLIEFFQGSINESCPAFRADSAAFRDGSISPTCDCLAGRKIVGRTDQLNHEGQVGRAAPENADTVLRIQLELVGADRDVAQPDNMDLRVVGLVFTPGKRFLPLKQLGSPGNLPGQPGGACRIFLQLRRQGISVGTNRAELFLTENPAGKCQGSITVSMLDDLVAVIPDQFVGFQHAIRDAPAEFIQPAPNSTQPPHPVLGIIVKTPPGPLVTGRTTPGKHHQLLSQLLFQALTNVMPVIGQDQG